MTRLRHNCWQMLHGSSSALYWVTRNKRFLAGAGLWFKPSTVPCRLAYMLRTRPGLYDECRSGRVCFGCIDTYLLWRLTAGAVHATDYSCASATQMYDAFIFEWSTVICGLLRIPMNILPKVFDTRYAFFCSQFLFL